MCCTSKRSKESKGCQKPENLKGKPVQCTPEQIRQCHGNVESHPCVGKTAASKKE